MKSAQALHPIPLRHELHPPENNDTDHSLPTNEAVDVIERSEEAYKPLTLVTDTLIPIAQKHQP